MTTYKCRKICESFDKREWHYYYFTQQDTIDENTRCPDHPEYVFRDFSVEGYFCTCKEESST